MKKVPTSFFSPNNNSHRSSFSGCDYVSESHLEPESRRVRSVWILVPESEAGAQAPPRVRPLVVVSLVFSARNIRGKVIGKRSFSSTWIYLLLLLQRGKKKTVEKERTI